MKFKIVYDKPQRIRFRCGAYAFDKEYEGAIYNLVTASPYVNSAQVSSANGGILVKLPKGGREETAVFFSITQRAAEVKLSTL